MVSTLSTKSNAICHEIVLQNKVRTCGPIEKRKKFKVGTTMTIHGGCVIKKWMDFQFAYRITNLHSYQKALFINKIKVKINKVKHKKLRCILKFCNKITITPLIWWFLLHQQNKVKDNKVKNTNWYKICCLKLYICQWKKRLFTYTVVSMRKNTLKIFKK